MTLPTLLFLCVVAVGSALFVCYLLCLVGAFLLVIGKGFLIELAKPEDDKPKRQRPVDVTKIVLTWLPLFLALVFFLGSRL